MMTLLILVAQPLSAQELHGTLDIGASVSPTRVQPSPLFVDGSVRVAADEWSVAGRYVSSPWGPLPGGSYTSLSLATVRAMVSGVHGALGLSGGTGELDAWVNLARRDAAATFVVAAGPWTAAARLQRSRFFDWSTRAADATELDVRRQLGAGWVGVTGRAGNFADTATLRRDTTYFVLGFPFRGEVKELGEVVRTSREAALELGATIRRTTWSLRGGARVTRVSALQLSPASAARIDEMTGPHRRSWLALHGAWPIGPRTMVTFALGRTAGVPEQRIPASRVLTLGARWISSPAAPSAPPVVVPVGPTSGRVQVLSGGDGRRVIVITGLVGQRVAINGDITDWNPVPLERLAGDVWQGTFVLEPGVYRVVISVDAGSWQPPPGLPVSADSFGEAVGILVVAPAE